MKRISAFLALLPLLYAVGCTPAAVEVKEEAATTATTQDGITLKVKEEAAPAVEEPIPAPKTPEELIVEALGLYDSGEYKKALEIIGVARVMDPEVEGGLFLEARSRYAIGDAQNGLPIMEKLLERGEGDENTFDTYILWSYREGRGDEAVKFLRELTADLDTVPEEVLGGIGWLNYQVGNAPEALDNWERMSDEETSRRYALYMARLYLEDANFSAAEREATRAMLMGGETTILAKLLLAEVKMAQGRAGAAKALYDEVLERERSNYEALNGLGLLNMRQEKYSEALILFKRATLENRFRPEAFNNLGLASRELGKLPEAEGAYKNALNASKDYLPALKNLGILYEKYMGRYTEAIELYERYLTHVEDDEEVARWLKAAKRIEGGG